MSMFLVRLCSTGLSAKRIASHCHIGVGLCLDCSQSPGGFASSKVVARNTVVGVSRPGGPSGRRVSAACPSPDGSSAWTSAKGGKERGGRRPARERWESRGLRVRPAPRSGALAVGGYKRPHGRGSERPCASAYLVLVPVRPTLSKRALVLPFIGIRRGCRCTMGV